MELCYVTNDNNKNNRVSKHSARKKIQTFSYTLGQTNVEGSDQ